MPTATMIPVISDADPGQEMMPVAPETTALDVLADQLGARLLTATDQQPPLDTRSAWATAVHRGPADLP